jgi:hypothetical protein
MWNVVMGFLALAGSVVRDGQGFDDLGRREAQRAATAVRSEEAMSVVETAPAMSSEAADAEILAEAEATAQSLAPSDWGVACERTLGGELVFDRKSVRELGGATLVRWSAVLTPGEGDLAIHTAVVDCRAKTIEASWPGKRTATRAGSCGRHLVDAVCAVSTSRAHRASR